VEVTAGKRELPDAVNSGGVTVPAPVEVKAGRVELPVAVISGGVAGV
jgi:hypothetical protein